MSEPIENALSALKRPADDPLDDRKLVGLVDNIVVDVLAAHDRKAAAAAWVDTLILDVLPAWLGTTREWAAMGIAEPIINFLMLTANGDDALAAQYLTDVHALEAQTGQPYFFAKSLAQKGIL